MTDMIHFGGTPRIGASITYFGTAVVRQPGATYPWVAKPGLYQLVVRVDPKGEGHEDTESNNQKAFNLSVAAAQAPKVGMGTKQQPDLSVHSLSVSPIRPTG